MSGRLGSEVLWTAAALLLATVLGIHGFLLVPVEATSPAPMWSDAAYRTLQLVALGFPEDLAGKALPISLQIARFLMPVAAAGLTLSYLGRQLRRPIRATAAAWRRGHVVVAGDAPQVAILARSARARGDDVNALLPAGQEMLALECEAAGAAVILGDGCDADALARAGVGRARLLVATYARRDHTLEAVLLAERLRQAERSESLPPLVVAACLGGGGLRDAVERIGTVGEGGSEVELRLLSPARTVARRLLAASPLDRHCELETGRPVHVLFVGMGEMGEEILLQILRTLHVPAEPPLRVTIVDRSADDVAARLLGRHPGMPDLCEIETLCRDALLFGAEDRASLEKLRARGPLAAAYVCLSDDELNWTTALHLRRLTLQPGLGLPPVHVRTARTTVLGEVLASSRGTGAELVQLIPFGGLEATWSFDALVDERLDVRARWLHEFHRENERAEGRDPDASPGALPWKRLAEVYRDSSREQADHADVKVRSLGLRAVRRVPPVRCELAPSEVEALARAEHARWCAERMLRGYRYAATRDEAMRTHPLLRPYDALQHAEQAKDARAVLLLQPLLEAQGLSMLRELRIAVLSDGQSRLESGEAERVLAAIARIAAKHPDHTPTLTVLADDAASCDVGTAALSGFSADEAPGEGIPPGQPERLLVLAGSFASAREQALAERRVGELFALVNGAERWLEVPQLAEGTSERARALAERVDVVLLLSDTKLHGAPREKRRLEAVWRWDGSVAGPVAGA